MSDGPQALYVAVCDLNGQARAKRLPPEKAGSLLAGGGVHMPLSVLNLDLWGDDIVGSPLVLSSGDQDGVLLPTTRGPLPMPWLPRPAHLYPATMQTAEGNPFCNDPRHALARVLAGYENRGWDVVAALEMEFYLLDAGANTPTPAPPPVGAPPPRGASILSLAQLECFSAFLDDLHAGCEAMGLAVESAISEGGRGQFEVTLRHCDALEAADNAWLFKMLARGIARKHGMIGSFMAKPMGEQAGSGLHVHVSVVERESGRNLFNDDTAQGSGALLHAVGGLLATMADATLIFAPHLASYGRFVSDSHAPTGICWGYDNRTTAVRIPAGPPSARRFEHRVAGADCNPYLLLAAVLGGAFYGVTEAVEPPGPIAGNAYEPKVAHLAPTWADARSRFEGSDTMATIFPPLLRQSLLATKAQEGLVLADMPEDTHWRSYVETC